MTLNTSSFQFWHSFVSSIWDELTDYLEEFRIKLQRGSFLHNQ